MNTMKATSQNLELLVNELEKIRQSTRYANICMLILKSAINGGLDAVYEDYIIKLVGIHGLGALKKHGHIELCGIVNGRTLYAICENKTK